MALLEIFDPKAKARPIGIDLGTTHSLVAAVKDGRPFVIADCDDEKLMPSVVSYVEGGAVVVGKLAKSQASRRPMETIASAKRFMGRGADDAETKKVGTYAFVTPDAGTPNVVRFNVGDRAVTPVEVSAEILRALKRLAEDELRTVGGVVITVPSYFDDAQRQATKDAGRLAGLDVLRLLNEPTAAALAYGLDRKKNGVFAVYDLGGGTFDVTILLLEDGVFQVKATGGDSALGGDDMDRIVFDELVRGFGIDASISTPNQIRLLLDLARRVKHGLSEHSEVDVSHPWDDAGTATMVARSVFEERLKPLLDRTGVACRRALKDAGMKAVELDGVILVGGATRVPAVRAYVETMFGRAPLADIDPDEVVALGAAIQADLLAGEGQPDDVLLLDVLPLSLGIEVGGGVIDKILPRNTTIPTGARGSYTTQEDNQTGFEIHVLQGERELAKDCRSLARFTLRGIPPMPAGLAKLDVYFDVDADGLLSVRAKETTTGVEQVVAVKPSYGLDDDTVEQMLLDAIDYGEEDLAARKLSENRVEAERIIKATKRALDVDKELLNAGESEAILEGIRTLERACEGTDAGAIHLRIEDLDRVSKPFAERRMDRAIASAMAGRALADIEHKVENALGIEAAHAQNRK